jgi:DNA-binding NtrC family response regulator
VQHLLRRASAMLGTSETVMSQQALDRLMEHEWPGNVRELENSVLRAMVLAAGNVIRPDHLSMTSPAALRRESIATTTTLEQMERDHVARVLAATGGHKSRAAELLGVSRPRLNRLLEKYSLE